MITAFTGPMFASKSEQLIKIYEHIYNKEHIKSFKPKCDDRDLGIIKSRNVDTEIDAICIEDLSEILKYISDDITTIFIDEVQMLKGNVGILSYLSIMNDIDIYVAGLNQTSEQKPFGLMPFVLAISDKIINVKASCYDCGREEALFSYYRGKEVKTDLLIGSDDYIPLCTRCLRKRNGEEGMKLLLKRSDSIEKK